jgi:diguanylate cyclase (GGDEF)-like protein/putative nucleotidyltransferase with HDIG domain
MAVVDCLILSITMIYGVAAGVIAHGPSYIMSYWSIIQKKPLEHRGQTLHWRNDQAAFNFAAAGIYAFIYGKAYYGVLPAGVLTADRIVLPVLVLAGTYFLLNTASMHAVMAISGQASFRKLWEQNFPLVPLYYLASASTAAVIYFFVGISGLWGFLLAIPILIVVYYAHHFYNEKFEEQRELVGQTVEAFANSIDALEQHIEVSETHGSHVRRSRAATMALARALGVDHQTREALEFAAMLHDVGKISIPTYILHKPSQLTEREMQKMRTHPEVGADILSIIKFQGPVIDIVKHHHENWDGSGYPKKLKGEEIPLGSRILAITDNYVALREKRVYRNSLDRNAAIAIMEHHAHRFDPHVFSFFKEHINEIDEALGQAEKMELVKDLTTNGERRADTRFRGPHQTRADSYSISAPQREVYELFEFFQTIGNHLSPNKTLIIVASSVEKIIPFDTLVIYLADEKGAVLTPAHTSGQNKEAFRGLSIDIGTRLAGWVCANNRMLYNVHPGPDTMDLEEDVRKHYQNAILAPLGHEDRPLGAIALYSVNQKRYNDDHIRLLEMVASRASISLYNAIRYEDREKDAFTDRLTSLPNSRFLYIFFEQTLSEAKRYSEPLTVIIMDLDDFKSINDRYGHHSGDRFLKEVGGILKNQMRESDVLVRYAGDEFIAVLPKTNAEQARLFSYRLQDAVEASSIDVGVGKHLSVGISLGLAAYPNDGEDLESLLMGADKSMYENKSRRKGRRRRLSEFEPSSQQPSLFGTEEIAGPRVR